MRGWIVSLIYFDVDSKPEDAMGSSLGGFSKDHMQRRFNKPPLHALLEYIAIFMCVYCSLSCVFMPTGDTIVVVVSQSTGIAPFRTYLL